MPPVTDAAACLAMALAASASPMGEWSAINFVNATGLPGRIEIRVEGEPVSRHGYAHGEFSGGLLFPAGTPIRVEASLPGCGPAPALRVASAAGESRVVVFYAVADPAGGAASPALRSRALEHREPSARRSVTAIYLGARPFVVVRSDGRDVRLPPDSPMEIWRGGDAAFAVALPHRRIAERLEERGHYWLILHDEGDGRSGHMLVPDPAYSVPVFD
ncbi:MAG: hypothetical protein IT577_14840 [Verrucomicrobiae bacterium]|nr:hypothetical protein [Verrucomicrobiae bacterium]